MRAYLLLLSPALASSFVVSPRTFTSRTTSLAAEENSNEEPEGLVFEGLDQQMKKVASDLDFGQIDFLAEAKKRAQQKKESSNAGAGDDEWKNLANEKKEQYGQIDDWENAVKEAGNADSQILMFTEPPADEQGEDVDDEPKLLLF
jgi:hypothetical protein